MTAPSNTENPSPNISMTYGRRGVSVNSNELGMRPMQERAYEKRGEQYLLIKSPPASGKSRALMSIALDELENQKMNSRESTKDKIKEVVTAFVQNKAVIEKGMFDNELVPEEQTQVRMCKIVREEQHDS